MTRQAAARAWVIVLLLFAAAGDSRCDDATAVLVELSSDSFGDGGNIRRVSGRAPELQILRSGEVRFRRDGAYWRGQMEPEATQRLARWLSRHALLATSRFVQTRRGQAIGLHGGAWWIRHVRDDGEEVLVVAPSIPRSGPLARFAAELWRRVPATASTFNPRQMFLVVRPYRSHDPETPWPFSDGFRLAEASADQDFATHEVLDPRIIAFINAHVQRPFFREGPSTYVVYVADVPGWFPPPATRLLVQGLYEAGQP